MNTLRPSINTNIIQGTPLEKENRIILSLDGPMKYSLDVLEDVVNEQEALGKQLIWGVKLNSLLLHDGIHLIRILKKAGIKVMADPKLFDIEATMSNSAHILHHAGADIFTVHGLTGFSVPNKEVMSKMACVTILTSWTEEMCNVANCTYALCVKRRLLPRGICGETVKRKTVERAPEEVIGQSIKLRGKALRKIGDREIF